MMDSSNIADILSRSPSVALLRLRNREAIILFLVSAFPDQQGIVSDETLHTRLTDYLAHHQLENEEESEFEAFDTYEAKAKKHIQNWTNSGFLTNYQDERGDIFYELSAHSSKTLDWLSSLQKEAYIGTESKFKNIFSQLKELAEFTNEDTETRIQLLEDKQREIEQQIQRIKMGADIKVFEEFEIIPRFNQLNQSAKELLSDFKEVEDNFREITKSLYQQHAEGSQTKSDMLDFTFDAIHDLKNSQQGKSFYAFYSFLLSRDLQAEWSKLTEELYQTLSEKDIEVKDFFLKGIKRHLHDAGQKVYKANDKMAEKLSRIIRENEATKSEATKSVIQEIKKSLLEISKSNGKPEIALELETEMEISIPFERKLTYEQAEVLTYDTSPQLADASILDSQQLSKLFAQSHIDKGVLRQRIREVLSSQSQATLHEIIENFGGIEKGLPELFGYISVAKEFAHTISPDHTQRITFDEKQQKTIRVPEIILTR